MNDTAITITTFLCLLSGFVGFLFGLQIGYVQGLRWAVDRLEEFKKGLLRGNPRP